jgi:hypothetical protein
VRLPSLPLSGVPTTAAELLAGRVARPVADRLVRGTRGNPLALLEVERQLTPAQRLGASPLPDPLPVGPRLEAAYDTLLVELTDHSRRAVLLCAISPPGMTTAIVTAIAMSGGDPETALDEAERLGILVRDGADLRFRHPLLRTAVMRLATPLSGGRPIARWLTPFLDQAPTQRGPGISPKPAWAPTTP